MNKIKHSLEYQSINKRRIIDFVDKVHFRDYLELGYEYNQETQKNNLINIDLLKSNYFFLNFADYVDGDYPIMANVDVNFFNFEDDNIQRFEIFLTSDGTMRVHLLYERFNPNINVVFPWGWVDSPLTFDLVEKLHTFSVITFRRGLTLNNKIEFVAIQSNWINV